MDMSCNISLQSSDWAPPLKSSNRPPQSSHRISSHSSFLLFSSSPSAPTSRTGSTSSPPSLTATPPSKPSFLIHHHRRHPFLHLTRTGTLDDDFFSGDDDNDRSLFGPNPKTQPNGSFVILNNFDSKLGFLNFITDNGIKVSEIIYSGFSFKAPKEIATISDHKVSRSTAPIAPDGGSSSSSKSPSNSHRLINFALWWSTTPSSS